MSALTKSKAQAYVREQKRRPCLDCQTQFPAHSMEYDHVRGEKSFNLGGIGWGSKGNNRAEHEAPDVLTLEVIDAEIAKCDVVCVICHRKRMWGDEL